MQVTFYGTRGSVPVSGPSYARYGGATTCLCIETGAAAGTPTPSRVIIDCGTGLSALGRTLAGSPTSAVVLQSHFHWDHVHGFPFFSPIYRPDTTLTLLAANRGGKSFHTILREQMCAPQFPVSLERLPAAITFRELPPCGTASFGGLVIRWVEVPHPSGCTAFRVEHAGSALVFTGDVELPLVVDGRLAELAQGAGLLVADCQYFGSEYELRRGWGHSAIEHAVELGAGCAARHLVLTHHDPLHEDLALDRKLQAARSVARSRFLVDNAYDGLVLTVPAASTAAAWDHASAA
ncbi:MAG: MBL fold metallo-hydrolase [Candidatus Schekmanbacteria bacterium]|nr:MBL fold metallo-hydrolase [Candidatus Schekmanbacteria bacterium]